MKRNSSETELPEINGDDKHDREYVKKVFKQSRNSHQLNTNKWDPEMTRLTKKLEKREPTKFDTDVKSYLEERRYQKVMAKEQTKMEAQKQIEP